MWKMGKRWSRMRGIKSPRAGGDLEAILRFITYFCDFEHGIQWSRTHFKWIE